MTVEELEVFLQEKSVGKIDINRLDYAAAEVASIYYDVSLAAVDADIHFKKTKSALAQEVRENPSFYGSPKKDASEAFIESVLPSFDEYASALTVADKLGKLVKALELRARMIEVLQRLFGNNYFVSNRSLGERIDEEDVRQSMEEEVENSPKLRKLKQKLMASVIEE